MMSSALRSPKSKASFAAIGFAALIVATLGAGSSRAQEPAVETPPAVAAPEADPEAAIDASKAAAHRIPNPFADRFPNLVLKTHEGKNVRFYEDLLKGKIVLINFMYATCTER